jgi:hypothetical protein
LRDFRQVHRKIVRSQMGRKGNAESVGELEEHSGEINAYNYRISASASLQTWFDTSGLQTGDGLLVNVFG